MCRARLCRTIRVGAHDDLKHEREKAAKLEDSLLEAQTKAKEARAALARKETYTAELKRKLEVAQQDVKRLSQETKLGRGSRGGSGRRKNEGITGGELPCIGAPRRLQ